MRPLLVSLLLCVPLLGQSSLDGDWIFEMTRFGQVDSMRMKVTVTGQTLVTKLGNEEFEGAFKDAKVDFASKRPSGPKFTGMLKDGVLAGTGAVDGNQIPWRATREPAKPANPRTHTFEPTEFHRVFSGAIPPALHI